MGKFVCTIVAVLLLQLIHHPHPVLTEEQESADDEHESGSGDDDSLESPPDKSFADIINLSIDTIISSNDAKTDKTVLLKYYFTDKKNVSIWPMIVEETEKATNEEFEERELSDMENSVKNVYRRILECDLNNAGVSEKKKKQATLVKCYLTLNEFIADGFVAFTFQRSNVRSQSHMLEMNMAYNVMVLLIHHMVSSMSVSSGIDSFLTQIEFYRIAETLVVSLAAAKSSSIQLRVESVSPTTICEIQQVLWQEFTGQCESRIRIRRDLDGVQGIGGTSNLFEQKLRATVTDKVTGEEICYAEGKSAVNVPAAKVKDDLTRICNRKRRKYVKQIRKEITEYYNDRSEAVLVDLPKLWGSNKMKLKKVQEELENRLKKVKRKEKGKEKSN